MSSILTNDCDWLQASILIDNIQITQGLIGVNRQGDPISGHGSTVVRIVRSKTDPFQFRNSRIEADDVGTAVVLSPVGTFISGNVFVTDTEGHIVACLRGGCSAVKLSRYLPVRIDRGACTLMRQAVYTCTRITIKVNCRVYTGWTFTCDEETSN